MHKINIVVSICFIVSFFFGCGSSDSDYKSEYENSQNTINELNSRIDTLEKELTKYKKYDGIFLALEDQKYEEAISYINKLIPDNSSNTSPSSLVTPTEEVTASNTDSSIKLSDNEELYYGVWTSEIDAKLGSFSSRKISAYTQLPKPSVVVNTCTFWISPVFGSVRSSG